MDGLGLCVLLLSFLSVCWILVFLFTVMVSCPFLSRFFGLSLSFSPGNVVGRDSVHWACELVLELQGLTVISVVHMVRNMLTLSFAVVESFRFSFCMVFRTPRNVKPVKLKLQFSVFECL